MRTVLVRGGGRGAERWRTEKCVYGINVKRWLRSLRESDFPPADCRKEERIIDAKQLKTENMPPCNYPPYAGENNMEVFYAEK